MSGSGVPACATKAKIDAAPPPALPIDLLSVDVDGSDYHILRALLMTGRYRPRALIIEHGHGFWWPSLQLPLTAALAPREHTKVHASTARLLTLDIKSQNVQSHEQHRGHGAAQVMFVCECMRHSMRHRRNVCVVVHAVWDPVCQESRV